MYVQAHIEEEERLKTPHGNVTRQERQMIQKKLFELIERFTGTHREKLILLFEDMGLVKQDMVRLRGWWKWTRIDAAYNLGTMRSKEAIPALLELLKASTYDPSIFIIARSIAKCSRDVNDLREMVVLLNRYQKNCHQLIVDIMSESHVDYIPLLVSFLSEKENDFVKIALIGLSIHVQPKMEAALHSLAQSTDKDIRIKAIKLLCRDSRYLTNERVNWFMTHHDWEIRAIAVKAIGGLGLRAYIPLLKEAVGDSNWWIRHNSANSLVQLDRDGFVALCEILQEERENIKRETAYQVIQKELEKGKTQQADIEKQLAYNHKLHVFHKLTQKKDPAAHVLEM